MKVNLGLEQIGAEVRLVFSCDSDETAKLVFSRFHQAHLDQTIWSATLDDTLGRDKSNNGT